MSRDIVRRRMDSSMDHALAKAREVEQEEGITIPPSIVGQMALAMFQARMSLLFRSNGEYDLPADSREGFQ